MRGGTWRILVSSALSSIAITGTTSAATPADGSNAKSVTLNQAVTLDQGQSAVADASTDVEDGRETRTAGAPAISSTDKPSNQLTLRHPAQAEDTISRSIAGSATVPWYRTGMGALAIVLVLVGGSTWAARKWMPTFRMGSSNILKVVGRANVTPKHSVALVHLGRRLVMVGVSGDRMTSLGEVVDPAEVAELLAKAGTASRSSEDREFQKLLVTESDEYDMSADQQNDDPRTEERRDRRQFSATGDLLRRLRGMRMDAPQT